MVRDTAGNVKIWDLEHGGISAAHALGAFNTTYAMVDRGNYSGNDTPEILWQNPQGTIGIWSTVNAAWTPLATIRGWAVQAHDGNTDFRKDGYDDVLISATRRAVRLAP